MTLARKLTIALGVIALGWLVVLLIWGPAPFANSFDDAYYYFTIGRNWANGHASTFDQIDRTNGYHPLWQLISIVPYLTGLDGLAAIRALLVFQLLLWVGAMALVIRVVADSIGGWPRLADNPGARRWCDNAVVAIFVVIVANPFVFKMTVNGLESGLVVPVSAALIALATRFRGRFVSRASTLQRWATGGLLALAFLARTDAVILIAVLVCWWAIDTGSTGKTGSTSRRDSERNAGGISRPGTGKAESGAGEAETGDRTLAWSTRAARIAQMLVIPVVVIVTYLSVNQVFFDTPLQISGTIKRLPLTPLRTVVALVWVAIGVAILLGVKLRIRKSSRLRLTRRFLAATGWYVTFCVGLLGYYSTLQEVPYLWYFAPLALEATLLAMLLVADLSQGAILEAADQPGRRGRLAARAPTFIVLLPLAVALVWSIPSYVDPGARALMIHDARAGSWIRHHLPPSSRIGSWDAGVIGYFADRRIVNLDGVVNSHAYYEAGRHGRIPAFLAARDVRWVANHGGDRNGRDPGIDRQIRSFFGPERAGDITVVYRDTYEYSGSLDGSRTDTSTKQMGTYVYHLEP